VPADLLADTPGAPPPTLPMQPGGMIDWEQVARGWLGEHIVPQAAQLNSANRDKRTIAAIIRSCEAREQQIQESLKPRRRFLGLF
jgi:hypothetical protein